MSKTTTLAAAAALATLVALPATSQASDCLGLDRAGAHVMRAVDDVGRTVTRVGDGVMRVGDRMLGWLLCDKHRM